MFLDSSHPANLKVLAFLLKQGASGNMPIAPPKSVRDPYWEQGSHPEIVERVWDQIGTALPKNARCLLHGIPALVPPTSGVILAVCYGTTYCLRVPWKVTGRITTRKWSDETTTDISKEFGDDWVFGSWTPDEIRCCQQMYEKWSRA